MPSRSQGVSNVLIKVHSALLFSDWASVVSAASRPRLRPDLPSIAVREATLRRTNLFAFISNAAPPRPRVSVSPRLRPSASVLRAVAHAKHSSTEFPSIWKLKPLPATPLFRASCWTGWSGWMLRCLCQPGSSLKASSAQSSMRTRKLLLLPQHFLSIHSRALRCRRWFWFKQTQPSAVNTTTGTT